MFCYIYKYIHICSVYYLKSRFPIRYLDSFCDPFPHVIFETKKIKCRNFKSNNNNNNNNSNNNNEPVRLEIHATGREIREFLSEFHLRITLREDFKNLTLSVKAFDLQV
jgi:hypothetical protein